MDKKDLQKKEVDRMGPIDLGSGVPVQPKTNEDHSINPVWKVIISGLLLALFGGIILLFVSIFYDAKMEAVGQEVKSSVVASMEAEYMIIPESSVNSETIPETISMAEKQKLLNETGQTERAKHHDQWMTPTSIQEECIIYQISLDELNMGDKNILGIGGCQQFLNWLGGDQKWKTKYDSSTNTMWLMLTINEPIINGYCATYNLYWTSYPDGSYLLTDFSVDFQHYTGEQAYRMWDWYVKNFDIYISNPNNRNYWIPSLCPKDGYPGGENFPEETKKIGGE